LLKGTLQNMSYSNIKNSQPHVTTQNELLLQSLMEFYNYKENMNKMIHIINGESNISLRIVDWFVTNFAKKIIRSMK